MTALLMLAAVVSWHDIPISYKINGPPKFKRAVDTAMTRWVIAGSGEIDFCSEGEPRLLIEYAKTWGDSKNAAETTVVSDEDGAISYVILRLNAKDYRWRRGKTKFACSRSYLSLDAYLLHELGHALGLLEHSSDPNSALFPAPTVTELSLEDTLRLKELYGF